MTSVLRPELRSALERLYPAAQSEALVADASTRRFHRLFLPAGGTRIVMDYGAPFEGETDDVRLERIFRGASLPVARVIDILPKAGALVLEDLGDQTLEHAVGASASPVSPMRTGTYQAAVDLASAIATRGTEALVASDRAVGPALDAERFRFEMGFFLDHYVGSYLGRPEAGHRLREPLDALAVDVASHPRVLCHRDYHSRNLMVRPDGTLAMVDIQDARWGPDTYDLASLLRDAYVDLSEREVDDLFECYRAVLPERPDLATLRNRFNLVAAQRMIKALGTFGYQIAILGRDRYKTAIPRTLSRLSAVLPGDTQTESLAEALSKAEILT